MKRSPLVLLVGLLPIPACADQLAPNQGRLAHPAAPNAKMHAEEKFDARERVQHKDDALPQEQPAGKKAPPVERKIVYTATVQIICGDFAAAEDGLKAAVKAHKGLIAHSEVTSSPGTPRLGVWRVRVPIPQFNAFREAVLKLGDVEKDTQDSEDVTGAYYDLDNHIKNKLAEEEGLRKLLEKSGGEKMENILAIRRELAAVRDDINRKEGQLRLIVNLTELTTVTVTLREKQKYDPQGPPEILETPTFGTRISHTFTKSWDALVAFVQFVVLAVTAAAPWLLPLIVVGAVLYPLVRRRRQTPPPVAEVAQPAPPTPTS
jgi:hypothetical protein